ncbi:NAD-dependent epimerase/dehydratase family protein [Rhizobium skierniewicense]|uniref:NAD-dependent epimerase/dehydratase family protein n=1 Tax=Rhizobium skierniewicense TaxID=984260 RepID=UPI001571F9BC|nr:NAD-dependent epimerase/dehydratase family protein [Rhizobium skierniewicense]NTF33481.1 NAD-dependent epimerase/dehydratase family protein [Rhizobium skierniewicense]
MIIGRGLVASAFVPYFESDQDVIVFAAGVSNSGETRAEEFLREEKMLRGYLEAAGQLIYFGSCSVFDPEMANTQYVHHKLEMEALVSSYRGNAIFRLPQVVGTSSNSNLLTNFLHQKIENGERFNLWKNARRNLIDVDDIAAIVTHMIRTGDSKAGVYNIASPFSVSILDIVEVFEKVSGKKAVYSLIDAGSGYDIDVPDVKRAASDLNISFDEDYIERTIRKYYGR